MTTTLRRSAAVSGLVVAALAATAGPALACEGSSADADVRVPVTAPVTVTDVADVPVTIDLGDVLRDVL